MRSARARSVPSSERSPLSGVEWVAGPHASTVPAAVRLNRHPRRARLVVDCKALSSALRGAIASAAVEPSALVIPIRRGHEPLSRGYRGQITIVLTSSPERHHHSLPSGPAEMASHRAEPADAAAGSPDMRPSRRPNLDPPGARVACCRESCDEDAPGRGVRMSLRITAACSCSPERAEASPSNCGADVGQGRSRGVRKPSFV